MHKHTEPDPARTPPASIEDYWNGHYGQRSQIWSGNVNPLLAREAQRLAVGRALDLGCGEGGDAVWLARQGWHVTAVDVSSTALDRGRAAAESAGVSALIEWQQHDLGRSFPAGEFDLVSAQFLQSPVELDRETILGRAAAAVAPGGSLLVVGHAAFPPWSKMAGSDVRLPTADEVLASMRLDPHSWHTVLCRVESREATGPDGLEATLYDSVVLVQRVS
ncbi:hypothetical protein BH09ACT6_BH09ACT6_12680 [soil metagenome]